MLISGTNESMAGVFRSVMGIAAACVLSLVFLEPKGQGGGKKCDLAETDMYTDV